MILNLVTAEPHKFSATVTVSYPAGATLTLVNTGTAEVITAGTTTGSYTFTVGKAGTYYVKAVENGGDERTVQSDNFTVSDGGSYSKTLVFPAPTFSATVGVTYPAGLTVKLTDGTTTLYSSGDSGTYNFTVPNEGIWTASASGCTNQSVTVSTKGAVYSLRLKINVTVTITGANNGTGVTYDGASHTKSGYTVSIVGASGNYTENDFTFTGTSSATRTDAGTTNMGMKAQNFTNKNSDYNVTFNVTDGYVTINQKAVTVKADNKSKTYGASDPALTVTITGRVSTSDSINYSISRASGSNVGSYTITPTGTRSQGNYYVTFQTGTFTINRKAVTVKADNKSKNYGDTDPTLTATVTGTVGSDTVSYTLSRTYGEAAGTYTITPSGNATQGNYTVTFQTGTLTIVQTTPVTPTYSTFYVYVSCSQVSAINYEDSGIDPIIGTSATFTFTSPGTYLFIAAPGPRTQYVQIQETQRDYYISL